jgi:opacity protein-like surface antigen
MKKLLTLIALAAATSAFAASPYVGASAGYLIDDEIGFYTARIGTDLVQKGGLTHSIEAEIGYASDTAYGVKLEIIPVMANYRLSGNLGTSPFRFYAGAGAGFSRQKLTRLIHDDAWAFAAQAFGGVEAVLTPRASLTLGARYLWLNDYTIANVGIGSSDDVSIELGIRFRL